MTRDDQVAQLVESARAARPSYGRGVWIAAAIVGAICAVAFVVMLLADAAPAPAGTRPAPSGPGFGTGLAIGIAVGLAIGLVVARRQGASHSSRSNP